MVTSKRSPNLTRHDMAVLYCDLLTMGGPDGWCYRTDGQLAEELGSHPSTVNKSRRKLRECGFIAVAERVRGRGNQQVLGPMLSLVAEYPDQNPIHDKAVRSSGSMCSLTGPTRGAQSGAGGPRSARTCEWGRCICTRRAPYCGTLAMDVPVR